MIQKWPLWWKVLATIGTAIVGIAGIVSAYYAVRSYHNPPSPPANIEPQSKPENQTAKLTNKNPIKRDTNKPSNIQNPPTQVPQTEAVSATPPQQINAPNGVVSINQQGGITAKTVNINLRPAARHLSQEQRASLLNSLRTLSGSKLTITSISGTKEAANYATEILTVINEAGISIERNLIGIMAPPVYGIIVSPDSRFLAFRTALQTAQIEFQIDQVPGPEHANMFIGLNPAAD